MDRAEVQEMGLGYRQLAAQLRGGIERRFKVKGVGQISDPAWGPDGRQIIFAGSRNRVFEN